MNEDNRDESYHATVDFILLLAVLIGVFGLMLTPIVAHIF